MKLKKNTLLNKEKHTMSLSRVLAGAICIMMVFLVFCMIYGSTAQKKIANNIVRLHIIANSDNTLDQDLKLKVRDAVIDHMHDKYPNGASRSEAVDYLKNNLPKIREIAEDVLRIHGSDEKVVAQYGEFPFPTKEYENITLPAGMYQSVRIELGEAKGQNWWCVMFPPLCVADDNALRMSQESQEQLKATLGEDSYELVTDISDPTNTEVQVKFRIVEWVQISRIKLAELISSLF